VHWLNWQLRGDEGPSGRGYFLGEDCVICQDTDWEIHWRSLD
jgi:hypothetical protein